MSLNQVRFIDMHRFISILFLLFTIAACSAPRKAPPSTYGNAVTSTVVGSKTVSVPSECTQIEQHLTSKGEVVPSSFQCTSLRNIPIAAQSGCTTVSGYLKQDGTYVGEHHRCNSSTFSVLTYPPAVAAAYAPCVTGSCGPIQVKGYTRKDGTYVRPHTRSRRK